MTTKLQVLLNSKSEIIGQLFELGIICTLAEGKKGIKGWNSISNREQYIKRILKCLEQNSNYNIAINLEASNLICLDIDDPEAFRKFFNFDSETFSTLSCNTPRGFHSYLKNDLGINQNYDFKREYGFEVHAKNHLSNFLGENYEINENHTEIKNASEFRDFFKQVQVLENQKNTQSNNSNLTLGAKNTNPLYTEVFNKREEYLNTEVFNVLKEEYFNTEVFKKESRGHKRIFGTLHFNDYEKDEKFIRFAFKIAFDAEPKKSMLCILHSEKRPSASVFQNENGRFLYKDFHNNKSYSLIDLLLEYYRIPKKERGLFRIAFAYFLETLFLGDKREFQIIRALRRFENEYLQRTFFLTASLSKLSELDNQEHFLSVRTLSRALNLKNITRANRLLNFFCLIDVLQKKYRGIGLACKYEVNENLNIETLMSETVKLSEIDIFKLSRAKALELFDYEKVNLLYRRAEAERLEPKEILKTVFFYEMYKRGFSFALGLIKGA